MELHPILEKDVRPNSKLWYVVSALGDHPNVRVGHTCTYIPGQEGANGKVYVIGGANPSGSFAETFILDLDAFSWDTVDCTGLKPRYEHAAFVPESQPTKIYIFGGADQSGNHNDIQVFDTVLQKWTIVTPSGQPPSARTYHVTTSIGDKFYVYSGGHMGSEPVRDRQVHCFDAASATWTTLNVRGDSPTPRHGHLVLAMGNKLYIHGGMAGTTFYDDLHVLDLDTNSWSTIKQKRVLPSRRAAHCGIVRGTDIYIFGGMNRDGALDDMYKFDTTTKKWTKVELDGPPPACRLDFSMCPIRLSVPVTPGDSTADMMVSSEQAKDVLNNQLRLGSAGSVRSVGSLGSAGSVRSMGSAGVGGAIIEERVSSEKEDSPGDSTGAVAEQSQPLAADTEDNTDTMATTSAVNYDVVNLCLVFGGMDTEGEIFDDCLVMLLD